VGNQIKHKNSKMEKIAFIVFMVLLSMSFETKAQGIQFKTSSFDELLTLAKNENKLIFIDFYTEWCGPCKLMAKTIFTDPKVAEFYNKEFICCKLDAENEGKPQAKDYEVYSYPSSVFVNAAGEMVYKKVGATNVDDFLKVGSQALTMAHNSDSYAELKKLYPEKSSDEQFLKVYINKMIQYSDMPVEAIEAYLRVQKSMKEDEVEMMEYLMKYSKYLICGGKAESILQTNFKEFFDIATRAEEKALNAMEDRMIRFTRQHALITSNPKLYETFLSRWKDSKKIGIKEDYNDFKLELLWLKKDYATFKTVGAHYLDSIVSAKTLDQIRADDKKRYDDYVVKENGATSLVGESVKRALKVFEAEWQTESIMKVGQLYLKQCSKKAEYKQMIAWTNYGMKLLPEDFRMTDLQSKIYAHQGNKKKALELKRQAVAMMSPTHKEIKRLKAELEALEKGESVN
jgi:thiol-disulfide isomerase/thioredoxin